MIRWSLMYSIPVIKYLGSKRRLVPLLQEIVGALPDVTSVCDAFSGTTRVAQALKQPGVFVHANDTAPYAHVLATAYVEADATAIDTAKITAWLNELNALPGVDGYVTQTFCRESRFFQPHNGMRIDAIRAAINDLTDDRVERAILLTSLMEAADRVDSTTGVQMAYLKSWAPRSHNDLELRMPALTPGAGLATSEDAGELATTYRSYDMWYLDPPYNQHSYRANYHIWETLVRDDQPATYGVACKRTDIRDEPSPYNYRRSAHDAFAQLLTDIQARFVMVSFNDEGFLTREDIEQMLAQRGDVVTLAVPTRRYVGAQIGIHNPNGKRVGSVSHTSNHELIYLAGEDVAACIDDSMESMQHVLTPDTPAAHGR